MMVAALILLAGLWVAGFVSAYGRVARWGVGEWPVVAVLSSIVPASALLAAVHVAGLLSLATGRGWVHPWSVLAVASVFTWLGVAWLGRGVGVVGRKAGVAGVAVAGRRRLGRGWVVALLIVAAGYGVFAVDALTRYPDGADALHYHLPVAVRWMQTQRMDLIVGLHHQSFPENGMVVVMLLAFGGLERLMNLAQWPQAVCVGLAVYGLARMAGVRRGPSWGGACLAWALPPVMFQAYSGYVDLYGAAAWMSSLLAICCSARVSVAGDGEGCRVRRSLVVLAGLSAGIALGSKTTYLLLVPLLGMVLCWRLWASARAGGSGGVGGDRSRVGGGVRGPVSGPAIVVVRLLLLFSACCIPCSIHWFARGAVQAGNPVYPLAVKVGDVGLLPGFTAADDGHFRSRPVWEKVSRWWHYPWREVKYSGSGYPFGRGSGVGAAFAAFVPLGVMLVLVRIVRGWWVGRGFAGVRMWRAELGLFAGLSVVGVLLLLTVFVEMLRFVLPLLVASAVCGAGLLGRLEAYRPRACGWLVVVSLAVTVVLSAWRPVHGMAGRLVEGGVDRGGYYGVPGVVDGLPAGSVVLNLADAYATYPLLGRGWTNRVVTPLHWRMVLGRSGSVEGALAALGVDFVYARPGQLSAWAGVEGVSGGSGFTGEGFSGVGVMLEPVAGGEGVGGLVLRRGAVLYAVSGVGGRERVGRGRVGRGPTGDGLVDGSFGGL